jgi:hypothetical protein
MKHKSGKMIYSNMNIQPDYKQNNSENCFVSGPFVYEGEWKDNKRNGRGKLIFSNGGVYDGEWLNDKRNGNKVQSTKNIR